MVTETKEQTEEQAPPEAIEPTSDAELTPSADAAVQADQGAPEQQEEVPADADAYVKSVLEKEGAGEEPEAKTQRPLVDPEVVRRDREALAAAYQARTGHFDTWKNEMLDAGIPEALVTRYIKEAKDKVNEEHADVLRLGHHESAATAVAAIGTQVWQGINSLPKLVAESVNGAITEAAKASEGGNVPYSDVLRIIHEQSVKSGEKSGYERGLKQGFTDGRATGERAAKMGSSGQQANGTGSTSGGKPDDVLNDLNASKEAKEQAYKEKYGFLPT